MATWGHHFIDCTGCNEPTAHKTGGECIENVGKFLFAQENPRVAQLLQELKVKVDQEVSL